ncbi:MULTISPECIES: hypothetical protein [unclassified Sphingomonas]|uniref:hypothetical protein n=1 Tax=unclassified Sphingomonas TaxID=196159 RepID=UPI001F5A61D4|nr:MULTISPECIES: hypothetical protein [unclassified Sphingomonas]
MERPISIIWFERCYLGAVAVGLVNTALSFNASIQRLSENPAAARFGPSFGSNMLLFGTAIGIAISATLWFFTARKRSVVAKWIIAAFFALSLVGVLSGAAMGTIQPGLGGVLAVVALVLNGIAAWKLFQPDARAWFGEPVA